MKYKPINYMLHNVFKIKKYRDVVSIRKLFMLKKTISYFFPYSDSICSQAYILFPISICSSVFKTLYTYNVMLRKEHGTTMVYILLYNTIYTDYGNLFSLDCPF